MANEEANPNPAAPTAGSENQPAPASGAPAASWLDSAPAEFAGLKDEASLKTFKNPYEVGKSYVEHVKKYGNSVALPTATDKPEEAAAKLAELYKKTGVPEKAEGYKVTVPDIRNNVWNPAVHKHLLDTFHKANLNDKQADAMYGEIASMLNAVLPNSTKAAEEGEAALRKVWTNEVEYDRNNSLAVRAMENLLGKKVLDVISTNDIGSNPEFLMAFAQLGMRLQEDGLLPAAQDAFGDSKSHQAEIIKLKADPDYLKNDNKARHKEIIDRLEELYKLEYNPVA